MLISCPQSSDLTPSSTVTTELSYCFRVSHSVTCVTSEMGRCLMSSHGQASLQGLKLILADFDRIPALHRREIIIFLIR